MANWTNIDVNSLLPGQPFTSAIALAYEENPRAIAEGASGAPKIANKTVAGSGTVTISGFDDFGGLWVRGSMVEQGLDQIIGEVKVAYSTDGGATFSSNVTISTVTVTAGADNPLSLLMQGEAFIDFASSSFKAILTGYSASGGIDSDFNTGTISGLDSSVTDIRISGFSVLFATPQGGESAS